MSTVLTISIEDGYYVARVSSPGTGVGVAVDDRPEVIAEWVAKMLPRIPKGFVQDIAVDRATY